MQLATLDDLQILKKELLQAMSSSSVNETQIRLWLNNKEASKFLNCSISKFERLRKDGKFPFSKSDGTYLYYRDDLNNYLLSNRVCLN